MLWIFLLIATPRIFRAWWASRNFFLWFSFQKIQHKILPLETQLIFSILWVWHLKMGPKSNKKDNRGGFPAFKSQRVGYQSNQKLLYTINIKIISSILISSYTHELKSHCHFSQGPIKNDWINFQPSCICTSMQKMRLFHLFSFEIQSILESHDQTGHTHFWPCPPNKFLISF